MYCSVLSPYTLNFVHLCYTSSKKDQSCNAETKPNQNKRLLVTWQAQGPLWNRLSILQPACWSIRQWTSTSDFHEQHIVKQMMSKTLWPPKHLQYLGFDLVFHPGRSYMFENFQTSLLQFCCNQWSSNNKHINCHKRSSRGHWDCHMFQPHPRLRRKSTCNKCETLSELSDVGSMLISRWGVPILSLSWKQ